MAGAGVQAGLCVMIDCNDGPSATDLATTGRFLVHILESRPAVVDTIRTRLHDQDVYGLASAEPLGADGKLPYTENLVNAVLLGDGASPRVPLAEVIRVLCPGGMLLAADKRLDENTLAAAGFEDVRRLDGPCAAPASRGPTPWMAGRTRGMRPTATRSRMMSWSDRPAAFAG